MLAINNLRYQEKFRVKDFILDSFGISVEFGPLESTGGKVWDAAIAFRYFLNELPELLQGGLRVLELGSGCGWLGMSLAKERKDLEVVMSERPAFGALDWLQHNIDLNPGLQVEAIELDWAAVPPEICAKKWDIIIGSELVYSYVGAKLLAHAVSVLLCRPDSVFFYAHSMNRFESVDEYMLEQFKENHLHVEFVFGKEKLNHDPGLFTELFPELQLVIFRITKY